MRMNRAYPLILKATLLITACSDVSQSTNQDIPKQEQPIDATKVKLEEAQQAYNAGNLDQAKALFEECKASDPANGIYEYYLGNIHRKMNNLDAALTSYQSAIKKSPQLIEPYNNITAIQMASQQFDQALEIANKGLEVQPGNEELNFKKAQILYVKQQYIDSIALLTKLTENQNYFDAHRFLGMAYIKLNDKTKAKEHLNKYLEVAPEGLPLKENIKQLVAELEK